jgi:hypothetical protein
VELRHVSATPLFPQELVLKVIYPWHVDVVRELGHRAVICDLEDGERSCACGWAMDREDCGACEDGFTAYGELHDMDPLWYDVGDIEPCSQCDGQGGWWVCPEIIER